MSRVMDWFERIVVYILIIIMMVIVLLSIIGLVLQLYQDISRQSVGLLSSGRLLDYFGYVLLVLIGMELLDTIRAYLQEHVVHVEIVLEVALIAVARKVIVLEFKDVPPAMLFGIAALIAALATAFYLEKRSRKLMKNTAVNAYPE
jgi:uncharacterized membrane protein (DUF373 family)